MSTVKAQAPVQYKVNTCIDCKEKITLEEWGCECERCLSPLHEECITFDGKRELCEACNPSLRHRIN